MPTVNKSFTAVGNGQVLLVKNLQPVTYAVSGTFVGTWILQRSETGGTTWEEVTRGTSATTGSFIAENSTTAELWYRFRCDAYTSGTITTVLTGEEVIEDTKENRLHKDGEETVTGRKTFTGPVIFTGSVSGIGAGGGNTQFVDPRDLGALVDGTTDDTAAYIAALDAADESGGVVFQPPGVMLIDPSAVSMAGRICSIRGIGFESVLKAGAGQVGAVLDLTGYACPPAFQGTRVFCDFRVMGDNTAGGAKKGILAPAMVGLIFRNISVMETGGVCFDLSGSQFNTLQDVTLNQPVNAGTADIPYFLGVGPTNGNRFIGLGVRSINLGSDPDVGPSGCIRFEGDGTYTSNGNTFVGCWMEFLHVATGGCVVYMEGNVNNIEVFQFFDSSKVTGATGTCMYRFANPAVGEENIGGNLLHGAIPGSSETATDFDYGVELHQSNNYIQGTKGYNGKNVLIAAGVQKSAVLLGGAVAGAIGTAVTDNSGNATNTAIDLVNQTISMGGTTFSSTAFTTETGTFSNKVRVGEDLLEISQDPAVPFSFLFANTARFNADFSAGGASIGGIARGCIYGRSAGVGGLALFHRRDVDGSTPASQTAAHLTLFGPFDNAIASWNVDGSITPATLADAAAANNTVFIGSDHSNKLCFKNGSGTVVEVS